MSPTRALVRLRSQLWSWVSGVRVFCVIAVWATAVHRDRHGERGKPTAIVTANVEKPRRSRGRREAPRRQDLPSPELQFIPYVASATLGPWTSHSKTWTSH